MLEDIVKVTTIVFAEALQQKKKLNSPINVYNVYRNLSEVISCVKLVANHYLALDLSEVFLQNSSFGKPIDKWRKFFNEDLSTLNNSLKRYLQSISSLFKKVFGITPASLKNATTKEVKDALSVF